MKKTDIKNSADMFLYKAIVDFNSGNLLLKSFENDEVDIDIEKIYFDFQQSAEKLLKALLTHHQISIEKTHDISKLIKLCYKNNIQLIDGIDILIDLTEYAVEGRYGIICDDLNDTQTYIDQLELMISFTKKNLS
jgi:HEPN domain-containing protein